jgi:GTP-binding protein
MREEPGQGEALFTGAWAFVLGVPRLELLPPADRPELAFWGRSNVGKSSLINALVGQRGLARVSNTPGRTQELNYFARSDAPLFLVDMPGYGFAKAPRAKAAAWSRLAAGYVKGRPSLLRVFLLVDARLGLNKETDRQAMALLDVAGVSYRVVLTKIDKLAGGALTAVQAAVVAALASHPAALARPLATSAVKGFGIAELRSEIAALLAASA